MSSVPAVIVKKGGLLNGLFYGFFGLLITTVVCGTGLGVYGMYILESKFSRILSSGENMIAAIPDWLNALPEWQEGLPPALADALNDRRAPEYTEQVDLAARLVPPRETAPRGFPRAVVTVINRGPETISLMAVRVVILDERGVPVYERVHYAATPVAIEDEWRGPLLPGTTRTFPVRFPRDDWTDAEVKVTIAELRVWQADGPADAADAPDATPSRARSVSDGPAPP